MMGFMMPSLAVSGNTFTRPHSPQASRARSEERSRSGGARTEARSRQRWEAQSVTG
jgi:hypothetical protein